MTKTREHLQNGLLIAAAMEVAQDNSTRAKTFWGRLGIFTATFIGATLASGAFDALLQWFTKKPQPPASPAIAPNDMPVALNGDGKTSWAQDVVKEKSCGCAHRS